MSHTGFILLLSVALAGCHGSSADQASNEPAAADPGAAATTAANEPAAADPGAATDEPAAANPAGPPESPHPYDETADARAAIDAAIAAAGTDGKPVLLVFGANWCPWCRRLDYLMRHDGPVVAALDAGFHLVHVNVGERHSDTNRAIDQAYGHPMQHGLPVLVVLNAQGAVVHTQETGALEQGDHHDPAKVLEFLRRFAPTSPSGVNHGTNAS